jgi:hypothetical protein
LEKEKEVERFQPHSGVLTDLEDPVPELNFIGILAINTQDREGQKEWIQ